jgi:hypothetical protein
LRLASVAFAALTSSTGARALYERRRATGDRNAAAMRHLFNRMLGQFHHCLQHTRTRRSAAKGHDQCER